MALEGALAEAEASLTGDSPAGMRRNLELLRLELERQRCLEAGMNDFIAKPVSLQVETLFSQEQYDIILL